MSITVEALAKEFDRIRKESGADEIVLRYADAASGVMTLSIKRILKEEVIVEDSEQAGKEPKRVIVFSAL